MNRLQLLLFAVLIAAAALAACTGRPTTEPDLVATQVAVERAAAATLTAEAQAAQPEAPTATPTATPVPPTSAPAATDTPTTAPPTAPAAPTPTPTQIVAIVFPVDGDDGNQDLHGSFIQSNGGRNVLLPGIRQADVTDPIVFRDRLLLRVEVFDENTGAQDGDGIAQVFFTINGPTGDRVYEKVEEMAPYCVLGGNDPACPVPSFRELDYTWPVSGLPIENGSHQAEIFIDALDGTAATWRWGFEIAHDGPVTGETPAQPEIGVLRPACGSTVTLAAGAPLELRYGIWANRGLERASNNEQYIQIELTLDGQSVQGQRILPPVADMDIGICGNDYEDSYWIYHAALLDSLSPGYHEAQVTFHFSQPVEDGYGNTYDQPFTQTFTILAQ